jgi:hypothetical protein
MELQTKRAYRPVMVSRTNTANPSCPCGSRHVWSSPERAVWAANPNDHRRSRPRSFPHQAQHGAPVRCVDGGRVDKTMRGQDEMKPFSMRKRSLRRLQFPSRQPNNCYVGPQQSSAPAGKRHIARDLAVQTKSMTGKRRADRRISPLLDICDGLPADAKKPSLG